MVKWTTLKLGEKLEEITPPGTSAGYTDAQGMAMYGETRPTPPANTVMGGGKTVE